jgi:N-acyl-D-aspartate/D-glutamate deacylase
MDDLIVAERGVEMPADVVIRGGTVFDGGGARGRPGDVAIEGGVIREVGPKLGGTRTLRRDHRAPALSALA